MYVVNSSGNVISREVLIDLKIINKNFPEPMDDQDGNLSSMSSKDCECITRQPMPDLPTTMPFAPTEENIPKLNDWFLERYKASAFNTCYHQPIPEHGEQRSRTSCRRMWTWASFAKFLKATLPSGAAAWWSPRKSQASSDSRLT